MTDRPAVGHRVAGRYRLEGELGRGSGSVAWRAFDERLERNVALRLFDTSLDRSVLEEHSSLAAGLTHPRVARIFDTGYEEGRFFVVSELLPGCLAWARPPLSTAEAVDLATQVTEALVHAHESGIGHGSLHPGNVLLSEQGAKVADFSLSGSALGSRPTPRDDLTALGHLLHLALTGRSPGEPVTAGQPLPADPPGLADLIRRLVDGEYETAGRVLADLRRLRTPSEPPSRARPQWWLVAVVAVALIAAAIGATQLGGREAQTPSPDTPAPQIMEDPYPINSVQDFDPFGDGQENRGAVANVTDGDPQTFWTTERYRGDPVFGRLKNGVGVIVDLGEEREVAGARVLFTNPGCAYEIRYSPVRAQNVEAWETAASVEGAGISSTVTFNPESSRWWLMWLTRLTEGVPGARGHYACGVADIGFFPPS